MLLFMMFFQVMWPCFALVRGALVYSFILFLNKTKQFNSGFPSLRHEEILTKIDRLPSGVAYRLVE